ncbi:MAG: hypothetical protein GXO58_08840 [Thermodesulfobacteria bacterium]|nr:hypothetical protein [Thermodesulfobacteriota bacterium]
MKRRQIYYYSNMSPFAALGFALLALGAFFLTLPILIAAFVIFGTVGAYLAWRLTRALKRAEEEMLKQQAKMRQATYHEGYQEGLIIDITPEDEERCPLDDKRF